MNVLLLGPRGSGKTTVGRALAACLHQSFLDVDDIVLARLGYSSVREAWAQHGEAVWRHVEAQVINDVLQFDNQIVALGGGTPTVPDAMRAIRAAQQNGTATTVYLKCPVDTLADRLSADPGDRPSLTGGGVVEEVKAVLTEREPIYLQIANLTVNGTDNPDAIAAALAQKLARPVE